MSFCIPKHISRKLLEAAKRGEVDMVKLYNMDSSQRRSFFEGYTTKENAEGINAGFEKAMASKQKDSLTKWANETFSPSEKKTAKYKDVVDRINELKADNLIGVNSEGFFQDLIATRLGVTVTETELAEITKRAEKLEGLYEKKNYFGLPTTEYFKEKRGMQDYMYSLVPASRTRIATSTIARGALLFSIKSPITNIVGNSVQGLTQSMEKRLSSGQFSIANPNLAREYVAYANKVYKESGYDITRMITLAEDSKVIGEDIVHSQGDGTVRKVGRVVEDIVFKKMLGAPDVAFSAISFADSAGLASTKIARKEGLTGQKLKERAAALFKDATRIDPQTIDGEIIRSQAIADAQYATFTNDSTYSTVALGIRGLFNMASGDLRVGDQIMPFVKTPANVIGGGLDAAGLSAVVSTYNLPGAIKEMKDGNLDPMRGVVRGYVRSGLGITLAFIIASAFDPDDFIGEYPTSEKERQLLELKNATTNSIKIGGKWVSLDYFGTIGAPLVGILYARKYGKNLPDSIFRYSQGVVTQSTKIPGFNQFYDTVKSFKDARPDTSKSLEENLSGVGTAAIDFIRARTIPAIVYDIAKATDTRERKADKTKLFDKFKSTIPGLRQTLPVDKTVIGDERKTESALSTLLFGARVRSSRSSTVIDELIRLDSTGNLPSITDVEKTSTRVKEFKSQVDSDKFRSTMDEFGTNFGKELDRLMTSSRYNRLDDEKKAAEINKVKDDQLERTLRKNGYRKPRKN
jgi:hypothetical protein